MCGRFTQERPASELAELFGAEPLVEDPGGHFNVAPTDEALVVVQREDRRAVTSYRWGLIPHWAGEAKVGSRMINARLETKKPDEAAVVGYDYTLRPILFVVPRGSPPAAYEARSKEAESLRSQFQSCNEGISLARGLRYVAVRPQVVKASAELPAALRDVLAKTEVGRLTAPETTAQGVEVFALCGKRQSDNAPAKKEIRDELTNETFQTLSKKYLKELRDQAMIEYR